VHDPPSAERLARLEQLFTAHHDRVLGYLLRRVSNRGDIDDLVAETFLTAWRRLDDVPADSGALPWLYAVARRVLANHRRGENRRTALADRLREAPATRTTGAADPEAATVAAAAWGELPERDRELLSLMAWEGLDTSQVAIVLGCSRNAVRIRLHRARGRFERLLTADGDTPDTSARLETRRAVPLKAVPVKEGPHD
jgi:RNA polymerase sigma-70 factor (ECF subfamily)